MDLIPNASMSGRAGILYWNFYARPDSGSILEGTTVTDAAELSAFLFVRRVQNLISMSSTPVPVTVSVDENINSLVRVPGSAEAFLLMHDPDVLCWKQLGSMIKYDLAVTTTQYEWLQLLYGTPLVMAPRKNVIIKNLRSA